MTDSAELLNLLNVILKHLRLRSRMESIKLRDIVNLNIIPHPSSNSIQVSQAPSMHLFWQQLRSSLLAQSRRPIPIILAPLQIPQTVKPQPLLQRQVIELPPERKLPIHLLLRDAKVLHVEEANVVHGMLELTRQLLLPAWLVELREIEGYELGPVEILLGLGDLGVGGQGCGRHCVGL